MYANFAQYYDLLTTNVDYAARADYFCRIIERHCTAKNGILLDLACGTGNLSYALSERGWDVIGVDGSTEMLSQAMMKLCRPSGGKPPLFLCQQMQELDLYGTVDVCVCALDSINHLTDPVDIERIFTRLSLFVESGGLFIFDANTPYKHTRVLRGETFVYEEENVLCVWQNAADEDDPDMIHIDLDFFEKNGKGLYSRHRESFSERAYPMQELVEAGHKAGFETVGIYTADTFTQPCVDAQRLVYVMENMTEHHVTLQSKEDGLG